MNQRQKYLNLLGLSSQATEQEIKKKYRKLVFLYHPDKNNGDNSKFIAITEAYDILMGRKEAPRAQQLRTSSPETKTKNKTNEERIKDAQQRFKEQYFRERERNLHFFRTLTSGKRWRIMRLNAYLGIIISFFILFDFCLPSHFEQTRILKSSFGVMTYGSPSGKEVCVVKLGNGEAYFASNIDYTVILYHPEVIVKKSWMLHNPRELFSIHGKQLMPHGIHFNFGTLDFLVLFLSILPIITYFFKRPTIGFTIIYYISLYVSTGVLIYYLLSNDRWAHLLTFGLL